MKTLQLAFAVMLIALTACTNTEDKTHNESDSTEREQKAVYTCPMHPSVVSDRPGACPVCGMALVRASSQKEMTTTEKENLEHVSLSPTQRILANVTTVTARRSSLQRSIPAVGVVDAAENGLATVSARFRGRIERMFVSSTGQRVSRGQPLFSLYSPDLQTAEQEFLLATGDPASRRPDAHERLSRHFGMTEGQIAELERTRNVGATLTFYSPIAGTILLRQVQEGQYVDEGTVLYQVADLSTVWIYLDVYEKDMRHIATGQKVHITTDAYPGEIYSGTITFIDPVLDPETRTIRVRSEFPNGHGRLKPNMYASAEIHVTTEQSVVVPTTAVLFTGTRSVVWVETAPNVFAPKEVSLGVATERYYQILSGLEEGDVIAATGGFLIDSESALSVPAGTDPHAGHTAVMENGRTDSEPLQDERRSTVRINVKGSYEPSVIRAKKDVPLTLQFYRDETSRCTEEVVFEELGIRRSLPAFKTTEIVITPRTAGEIHFACGMSMVHGKVVVEP